MVLFMGMNVANTDSSYSQKNRETTKAVDTFLLKNYSDNKEILRHIKHRQETSPTKIKSFFIRLGYEIGGGKDWNEIIPLCAMCELLNIGNYLIEQGIDEVDGSKAKLGHLIRKLVLESKFLTRDERGIFKKMIEGINEYLEIDNKVLLWRDKIDAKNFFRLYKKKCFLVGGQFYGHCLELGFLRSGSVKKDVKKHLIQIGQIFGTYYQMMHEVADLLPESLKRFPEDFKYYQKQYNSFRKRKLTLPIYFALYEWKDFNKELFFELFENDKYEEITEMFLKAKIIKKCKTYIRKSMGKDLASGESPWNAIDGIWVDSLKYAVNAVNSNRFWQLFRQLYHSSHPEFISGSQRDAETSSA